MVPSGWKKGSVEDIATVTSGGTPSRKNDSYWNGHIPWVTTSEVKFGVITDTEQKITQEGLDNSSAKMFPENTLLIAMYGQGKTRGQVAKLGIEASTNQACAALLLNDDCEVDYYFQFLTSQYDAIRELANSGGQQNLSAGIIKNIHVPIPPLPEQRKIAKILATWDKAIATTEKLIAASQQQKKALMQQLLTGKKRLTNPETGQPFDGDWEEVRLGNVSKPQQWPTISSKELLANGYPVYGANGHIGYYSEFNHEFETVAVTCRGSTCGEVSLVPVKSYITGNAMCLDEIDEHLHSYKFMFYALSYRGFKDVISGSAQPQIVGKAIKAVKLSFPSLPEQLKIVAVLTATDKEIEVQQAKLTHLKQEKKALMQQLLTGKRRVTIDEQEVA